jgi:hypothetical protein
VGVNVCTSVECSSGMPCQDGYVCKDFLCDPKEIECEGNYQCAQPAEKCLEGECVGRNYCEEDNDCDNGFCIEEEKTCEYYEEFDTIVGVDGVDGGNLCAPKDPVPAPLEYLCKPCDVGNPCSCNPGECVTYTKGDYCASACTDSGQCPSGYTCDKKRCRPLGLGCGGCVGPDEPCDVGKTCDFGSGNCITKKKQCDPCASDYQCGPDFRCGSKDGLTSLCMPECSATYQCPVGSSCETRADGVLVCIHKSKDCCYGSNCNTCTCESPTPICFESGCVQCLVNTDCPNNHPVCNLTLHNCELYCQSPTPVYWIDPDTKIEQCVQCTNSAEDCPLGYFCGTDKKIPSTYHKCYAM